MQWYGTLNDSMTNNSSIPTMFQLHSSCMYSNGILTNLQEFFCWIEIPSRMRRECLKFFHLGWFGLIPAHSNLVWRGHNLHTQACRLIYGYIWAKFICLIYRNHSKKILVNVHMSHFIFTQMESNSYKNRNYVCIYLKTVISLYVITWFMTHRLFL